MVYSWNHRLVVLFPNLIELSQSCLDGKLPRQQCLVSLARCSPGRWVNGKRLWCARWGARMAGCSECFSSFHSGTVKNRRHMSTNEKWERLSSRRSILIEQTQVLQFTTSTTTHLWCKPILSISRLLRVPPGPMGGALPPRLPQASTQWWRFFGSSDWTLMCSENAMALPWPFSETGERDIYLSRGRERGQIACHNMSFLSQSILLITFDNFSFMARLFNSSHKSWMYNDTCPRLRTRHMGSILAPVRGSWLRLPKQELAKPGTWWDAVVWPSAKVTASHIGKNI